MKHILLLTTGGTIASRPTEEGLAPGMDGDALTRHFPLLSENYALTVRDILHLAYDGVVITHGTDTMAYTASVLSFMLRGIPIPVVLTGSQLPIEHPLTDALENLRLAFAMAATGQAGVFLAFDRRVLLGAFIQGASIELSADAPMREPYTVYLQGGLTYESGKAGVLLAVEELLKGE